MPAQSVHGERSTGHAIVEVSECVRTPTMEAAAVTSCQGKSGVVTGASGGLGRSTVLALAADGANVIAVSRNVDALSETVMLAGELAGTVVAMPADVCDEETAVRALALVEERFNTMDFVVNNAGMQIEKGLLDTTNDDWDVIDRTNVRAPFWFCKYAAQAMLRSGDGGSIVNIASTLSISADPMLIAYTASKHALLGLTRGIAVTREFARSGIRCNAVLPGDMDTPMVQKYFAAHDDPIAPWGCPCRRVELRCNGFQIGRTRG